MKTAISEIYASIQGEGPYTGERQIFVRIAGCPLRCRYCDTPSSLTAAGHPERSLVDLLQRIEKLSRSSGIKTVSLTGGEPLAHENFVGALSKELKKRGFKIYLETAGVHPRSLSKLIRWVDVVSMDIKLPSAIGKELWSDQERFLAVGGRKIFVKIVIEDQTNDDELCRAFDLIARRHTPPLVILQPATPVRRSIKSPSAERLAVIYAMATARLPRVLIMSQQHPIWGVR